MALIANPVFASQGDYQGLELVAALLAFTVQFYGDFSGYSAIARGLAQLMGFELRPQPTLPSACSVPTTSSATRCRTTRGAWRPRWPAPSADARRHSGQQARMLLAPLVVAVEDLAPGGALVR